MSALELLDVVVDYHGRGGQVRAVAGASLTVERGRIVGLVGESGCGKSTLARAAVGLVATTSGTVTFEGQPVTALRRRARPAELVRLQLVFQNPYSSLNPRRTIGSQLADGMPERGGREARVRELLELVGLPANAVGRYPHEFSGGQRQRMAVARALAADPSVIVLDEPLASLDASAQAQLANLLKHLSRELDVGLLLISHDLAIVRHVADDVSVMYLGRMVETAPTAPLWERPAHPYTEALTAAVPRADGAGVLPESLPGRGAGPGAPAERLPLPSALPVRVRPLPGRGAAAHAADRRPVRRLLVAGSRRAGGGASASRTRAPAPIVWRPGSPPGDKGVRFESYPLPQMAARRCRSPPSWRLPARPPRSPRRHTVPHRRRSSSTTRSR